jgi:hypothetical protein
MAKFLSSDRVECLNEIRPGKICGTHLTPGMTWCPVCGEPTMTRRIDDDDHPPYEEGMEPRRRTRLLPFRRSAFNGFEYEYGLESY